MEAKTMIVITAAAGKLNYRCDVFHAGSAEPCSEHSFSTGDGAKMVQHLAGVSGAILTGLEVQGSA